MEDKQVMHAMSLDDAYHVERVLARGAGGVTEIVSIGGTGPFVRKKIPLQLARRNVWSTLGECSGSRLPHVEATYELPDCFVVVVDYVEGDPLEDVVSRRGRFA
ncbi:MAG TPA: serine/threonine protein kinase, partial [Bifidobacterium sp.]|nr:serine/threonine protein kinase [Bifidobacterium sp.]